MGGESMKTSWKKITSLLLPGILALGMLSAGCGGGKSSGSGGKTINIALHQDPPKLDPMMSTAFVDRMVFQSVFDKLVDLDSKGNIVPMLAEKWEISPDGKKYTFHLRKGVKFHDGTEFNAEAVKFNLERYKQKKSNRRNELKAVAAIKVIDPYTVELDLDVPYAPLLANLTDRAGMMCSPTAVKKDEDKFLNHPVGTGPYAFKERSKGNRIVLVKNKDYWKKDSPKADTLVYKIMTDGNVALVNLKSGQVDMINRFPLNEVKKSQNEQSFAVINEPSPGFEGIVLNTANEKFKDKRVRQAIDKALDRNAIVSVALSGVGTPAHSALSKSSWAYDEALDKAPAQDIEGAKKLLAEAGKAEGFSFTIQTDTDPISQQVCQVIQKQLKAINIDMQIQKMDFGTLLDRGKKGDFEAATISWSGRMDPDGNLYDWFHTGTSMNYMKYSNPAVDELLEKARGLTDQNQRKGMYQQIMAQLSEDEPYIFLYHDNNVFGLSKKIEGFVPNPDGMIRTVDMMKK